VGADVAHVHAVETACFKMPWSHESILSDICLNENALYFVAEECGKIVGFCGIHIVLNEGHIMNVAVLPEHRGRGIGEALLLMMMSYTGLPNYTLEVRVSNTAAISLYKRLGFLESGLRPGYYGDEDALIMWRGENAP
jgi:ribosomal-protein-alanine N-acetyltransferase